MYRRSLILASHRNPDKAVNHDLASHRNLGEASRRSQGRAEFSRDPVSRRNRDRVVINRSRDRSSHHNNRAKAFSHNRGKASNPSPVRVSSRSRGKASNRNPGRPCRRKPPQCLAERSDRHQHA